MEKANLFIVGAAKCGTTSLHEYLQQHPEIYMSDIKEPHFFSEVDNVLYEESSEKKKKHTSLVKDISQYNQLFEAGAMHVYRGESSPSYLWDQNASQKIYEYNPQSKIIIMLRNPIRRAFSHFQMGVQAGFEKNRPFHEALMEDMKLPDEEKGWNKSHLYLELGFYYQQIKRYTSLFPKEQIKIIKFEDFKSDISLGLKEVFSFLGLSTEIVNSIQTGIVHNQGLSPKYPIIDSIKNNSLIQNILANMPEGLKNLIKNQTHQKGYRKDLVLEEKTKNLLEQRYKEDLQLLEDEFGISF